MRLLAAQNKNLRLFIHDIRCSGTEEDLKAFQDFLGNPSSDVVSRRLTASAAWRLGYQAETFVDAVNDVAMILMEFTEARPHLWIRILSSENLPVSKAQVTFLTGGTITDSFDTIVRDPARCDYEDILQSTQKPSRQARKKAKRTKQAA